MGHAIFLEDGIELCNTITGNLIAGVRNPPKDKQFLQHDGDGDLAGAGGMWLINPDNTVTGNVASDAQGNGYWLSYPNMPLGLNKAVPIRPANLAFGKFDDNVAHSNQMSGINFDLVVLNANETGETTPHKYIPTKDGLEDRYDQNRVRFGLNRIVLYKNRAGGMWNRVSTPEYKDFVSADNGGTYFAGAGDDGKISGALVVGYSLNNRPLIVPAGMVSNAPSLTDPRVGFTSYHSTFDMFENTVVNMPMPTASRLAAGRSVMVVSVARSFVTCGILRRGPVVGTCCVSRMPLRIAFRRNSSLEFQTHSVPRIRSFWA